VERTFRSFHCCFPPVCIVFCPVRYLPVSHRSRTQHLCMRAGKHEGLIFRYSWTQIHIILRQCRKSIAVSVSSLVYIMLHSEDICHQILKSSKTWRIGTNSGPIFRRLWTEVHEILRQYIEPFVVSKAVFWSAMVRFNTNLCAIKLPCFEKGWRNSGPILAVWGPKFIKCWCGSSGSLLVTNAVPDCPHRVLLRRYWPLSLEVVEKNNEQN